MTSEPQSADLVRCRHIAETELDRVAELLARGFPRTNRDYWMRGFERWRQIPRVEGVPRYGHVLVCDERLVGVVLSISSRRGERLVINVSSWFVEKPFRAHAVMLARVATSNCEATYVNASPARHTWGTIKKLGFAPYNFGRSAGIFLPGPGRVSRDIPGDLPEAQLMHDHRMLGLESLVVEMSGITSPFVFQPRRLGRLGLPMMDLLFCRDMQDFLRCAPALSRHFLARGKLGFLLDGRVRGPSYRGPSYRGLSYYVDGKEPRYFKAPHQPMLGDLAYTEKVIFG